MPLNQSNQLESILDGIQLSRDIQALNVFLQKDFSEHTTIQCSQRFLNKLDTFINKSLDHSNSRAAALGLTVLYKCGKNLKLPGGQGLSALIAQGLVKKWFEKCRQLWVQGGTLRDENLLNLAEDYFDALMEVHESCSTGAIKVTESFLYPVGHLAVDPQIYILIQKEAIRKFNYILDKSPMELKKDRKILRSQEAADIMIKLASRILEGGDYDLQTALMEALCRMATSEQRRQLADRWFTMQHVSAAFVKMRDTEFETDCRKFLNMINGIKGDNRSVFSYPCLEVYLGKTELLMPADEKLEEYWIDFNVGSHSISFYFSLPDEEAQEGQWETMCINKNEVQTYTVTEKGKRKLLRLDFSEVVVAGSVEGSTLTIYFSSCLDILSVVQRVYGHNKNTGFVGKTGTSVVKTTVKIIMDENSSASQIVPESQMSLGGNEKNVGPYSLPAPTAPVQLRTPAKMRISESATYISSSGGGSSRSASAVLPSVKCKGKPSLEMVRPAERPGQHYFGEFRTTAKTSSQSTTTSAVRGDRATEQRKASKKNESDKYKKNTPLAKAGSMVLAGPSEDQPPLDCTFVPDSQPTTKRNILSNWHKFSVSEMLMMPTQKMGSLPRSSSPPSSAQKQVCPSSAQRMSAPCSGSINPKQLHAELSQRLQEVLNKRNQAAPPPEVPGQKRKMSGTNQELKLSQIDAQVCEEKEKKTQRKSKAKDKGKTQIESKAVHVTTPGVAVERTTPTVTTMALSSKDKRDAEVTGNMVKHISSHYEVNSHIKVKGMLNNISQCCIPPLVNRPLLNMKWHTTMGNVSSLMNNKAKTPSTKQSKDVFAFSIDTPQSIGKKKALTSTTRISCTDEESSALPSTKKEQPPPKAKRYVKKHLFSDTDHDTTDVSWLRESSRKPKPKVNKYSRQAPAKPQVVPALTSCDLSDLPLPFPKQVKASSKSVKEPQEDVVKQQQKTVKAAPAVNRPPAAGRRPPRAAANTPKNYKETDTDGSQSESELFKVGRTEKTHEIQERNKKNKQASKSYMQLESHNSSQSESETKQLKKYFLDERTNEGVKIRTRLEQATNKRLDNTNHTDVKKPSEKQQKPVNVLHESAQKNKKPTKKNAAPVKEQTATLKDPWAACQASLSPPSPFIERMRSAERSGPTLDLTYSPIPSPRGSPLAVSPNPFGPDPLTPILLLPKPRSTVSSAGDFKTSSFYNRNKKQSTSKTQSIKSVQCLPSVTHKGHSKPCGPVKPRVIESPDEQHLSSPPQSPLSLSRPLMTSTLVNQDKAAIPSLPPSPFPEVNTSPGSNLGLSKISPASQLSLSHVSSKSSVTSKVKDNVTIALSVVQRAEKTPEQDQSLKSAEDLVSGPNRKRHISYSSSSNSEEDEKEQKKKSKMRTQHSPRMKPRKLFKSAKSCDKTKSWRDQSCIDETNNEGKKGKKLSKETVIPEDTVTEASADGGVSQVLSSSHTVISGQWEADVEDADVDEDGNGSEINPRDMCRQFSCELQKKFKSRFKIVEVYNKQSLKTVQQHISTINSQMAKHRSQRVEQVQKVLLEEIHKLEQNDTVLKNMENDLTMNWNKQTLAFHSLQKQEKKRNEVLRKTLENNMCHSLEYEERVFTSQMCLIRKDMKSVQDRLLSEMQEGEIQSVKRGLHALFFPDATRF